ncbi:MAG: ATP-binding protein [Gemmatimonadota bacterium]
MPRESTRFEQLRKLTEISRALTYATAPDRIMQLAALRAAELLNADRALLMMLDDEGLLQVSATYGVNSDLVDRFRQPLDETLGRRVQGLLGVADSQSFAGVPLVANGAVKGLLGVVREGAGVCSEEEEWLLSAVADQVAVALENSRLEEEVARARVLATAAEDPGEGGYAKDRALATLSHDLRSPLNAIDSYAELMEMELFGPLTDRQREALGRIRLGGRHLLAVLQNVLDMARLEAGALKVDTTLVALAQVVEEALFIVRHTAMAREQQLTVDARPPIVVSGDPDRLRQVLINIVGNAIKYSPLHGKVHVSTGTLQDETGVWGVITVSDDGPGIAADHLEKIFRPYFRIDQATDGAPDGAGLGLAISREIVRQMDGDILVESRVGEGSTFTVKVPLATSRACS